jgi:glycosyltransferase involved in cell wall biosynthesis
VLFAAKLIDRKRPDLLLGAFGRVHADTSTHRPYLLFAGDGPMRAELEARAAAIAPHAVRFLGFQPQGDLPRWYDLCDLFVLPSAQDSWGLVINEVMCAGRAVIASDRVGAAADLVRPGENGAIFRTDHGDDLTRVLREALVDPMRLAAMGQRSLEIIDRWSFTENVAGLRRALASQCPGLLTGAAA